MLKLVSLIKQHYQKIITIYLQTLSIVLKNKTTEPRHF